MNHIILEAPLNPLTKLYEPRAYKPDLRYSIYCEQTGGWFLGDTMVAPEMSAQQIHTGTKIDLKFFERSRFPPRCVHNQLGIPVGGQK